MKYYTTIRKIARAAAIASACVLPSTVGAYLSPEQVFGGEAPSVEIPAPLHGAASSTSTSDRSAADRIGYTPPPTARESQDNVLTRQQQVQQSRDAAQSALIPSYAEPEDTFIPAEEPKLDRTTDEAMYNLRMQRLQEQNQRDIASGRVLHSGAPLVADTGLGTILSVITAIIAAGTTLFMARKKQILK